MLTQGITNSISNTIKALKHANVSDEDDLNSVFNRLINVNFDGVSAISGHISGVKSILKYWFLDYYIFIALPMCLNWNVRFNKV